VMMIRVNREVLEIGLYENIEHEKVSVISGELERPTI
jgi:hypothetical protein